MKSFELFLRPVITEKATDAEKSGKYQFFVRRDATKIDVRNSFEKIYGVKAVKVNVIRTPTKSRLTKSRMPAVKKPEFKKVIVTTKGKKTLDITKPKVKT